MSADLLSNPQHFSSFYAHIKDNYPHKVCPTETHISYQKSMFELADKIPKHRIDFLEIVIENLAYFDTEMILGEEFINDFEPEDNKILKLSS